MYVELAKRCFSSVATTTAYRVVQGGLWQKPLPLPLATHYCYYPQWGQNLSEGEFIIHIFRYFSDNGANELDLP